MQFEFMHTKVILQRWKLAIANTRKITVLWESLGDLMEEIERDYTVMANRRNLTEQEETELLESVYPKLIVVCTIMDDFYDRLK